MKEITGALIGIGLVLTAVFLPMAFFGGSTGVIYRQFSVTIVSAMSLSIMVRAGADAGAVRHLAEARLRRRPRPCRRLAGALLRLVQPQFRAVPRLVPQRPSNGCWIAAALIMVAMPASWRCWRFCSVRLPTGFLPDEDQGFIITLITLPPAPPSDRTPGGGQAGGQLLPDRRKGQCAISSSPSRASVFAGAGQNAGMAFTHLQGLERAPGRQEQRRGHRAARLHRTSSGSPTPRSFRIVPPVGAGTGQLPPASTWRWRTAAISAMPRLIQARNQLLGLAARDPPARAGAPQQPGRHAAAAYRLSTRKRPTRWASPPPTSTPPCPPPGAATSSTISSTAPASSASICRATRPTA